MERKNTVLITQQKQKNAGWHPHFSAKHLQAWPKESNIEGSEHVDAEGVFDTTKDNILFVVEEGRNKKKKNSREDILSRPHIPAQYCIFILIFFLCYCPKACCVSESRLKKI